MKVKDAWELYQKHLEKVRDPKRAKQAWRWLAPAFANKTDKLVRPVMVKRYIHERQKLGAPNGTIAREINVLRAALRHAYLEGKIDHVPLFPKIRTPRNPRPLTQDDIGRLLEAAQQHPYYDLVRLCLHTGQRLQALLDLTWDRVSETEVDFRTTEVFAAHRMKGRAVLPLAGPLKDLVEELRAKANGPFVLHAHGIPITFNGREWQNLAKSAGITGTFHQLRHTVASYLLTQGISTEEVQRLLAHSSVRTTEQYYLRHDSGFLRRAVESTPVFGTSQKTAIRKDKP